MASGRVVRSDTGEGVERVVVSDGRGVWRTDAGGYFDRRTQGDTVFVVRPTGFSCHQWYATAGDALIEIVLDPEPQSQPFSFAHITDLHVTAHLVDETTGPAARMANLTEAAELTALLDELGGRDDVAFVAATGDLTNLGLTEELTSVRDAFAASPIPVVVAPGNHDHMNGEHEFTVSRHGYLVNLADVARYEALLGPRWYSFDHAGVHFVVLDWHTHELGLDHEIQDAWLARDLAELDIDTPWILLAHDQFPAAFFARLARRPIATFSGHWHTSRVVDEAGTLHVNSPNTFFAGLDYNPPSLRVVTVEGSTVGLATTARIPSVTTASSSAPRWQVRVPGRVLRAAPATDGVHVVVASHDDDHARGALTCVDAAAGTLVWQRIDLPPLKAAPLVVDDAVVVTDVLGTVHCVERAGGDTRWVDHADDPLRHWGYTRPAGDATTVFAGDQTCFRAIDTRTGARRWLRDDLTLYINLVAHGSPVAWRDRIFVGFWPLPPSMQALSVSDGSTLTTAEAAGSLASGFAGPTPVGDPALSLDGTMLFVPSGAGTFALDTTTLETLWHTPATGLFNPARPTPCAHGVAVVIAEQGIRMLDPRTGAVRWSLDITGGGGPFTCYGHDPHALLAEPAVWGDDLVLAGVDGRLRVINQATGTVRSTLETGLTVVAAPLVLDDDVVVAGLDGTVTRLALATS